MLAGTKRGLMNGDSPGRTGIVRYCEQRSNLRSPYHPARARGGIGFLGAPSQGLMPASSHTETSGLCSPFPNCSLWVDML